LATDDEEEGSPQTTVCTHSHRKKIDAQRKAQLARARILAQKRMDKHELNEEARILSVLDNVSEKESPAAAQYCYKWERSGLKPSSNPYIEDEAIEVGDDDSDLNTSASSGDDSFINDSDEESTFSEREASHPRKRHKGSKAQEVENKEDPDSTSGVGCAASDESDGEVMYEDFSASRAATLKSIEGGEWRKRSLHSWEDDQEDDGPLAWGESSNENNDSESDDNDDGESLCYTTCPDCYQKPCNCHSGTSNPLFSFPSFL